MQLKLFFPPSLLQRALVYRIVNSELEWRKSLPVYEAVL